MSDIVVTVDGSSLYNGQPYAVGGWGAVIRLANVRAEACRQLCGFCNPTQSNSCAEIRAVQFAQNLLQEIVKMGHPLHLNPDGSRCRRTAPHKHDTLDDGRPDDETQFNCVVRTDSEYVVKGMYGKIRVNAHSDLWHQLRSNDHRIESNGSQVQYSHVYAHSGDEDNERADSLARLATCSRGYSMYRCCSCELYFSDGDGLACHLKEKHLGRDLTDEMERVYDYYEQNGEYCCILCGRVCELLFSMWQHNNAKH